MISLDNLPDQILACEGAIIQQVQVDLWEGEITRVILYLEDGRTLYFARSNDPIGYHWTVGKWDKEVA